MMCVAFACNVLKAGGIFGDLDFNCNEMSMTDLSKLSIYDKHFVRPSQCVEADPDNKLCQLGGKYEMNFEKGPGKGPRFNFIEPHDHMNEKCTNIYPEFYLDKNC